jgi:hypothetical protein
MKGRYRQGFGPHRAAYRRVDIGRGQLITQEQRRPGWTLDQARSLLLPRSAAPAMLVLILLVLAGWLAGCAGLNHAATAKPIAIESVRLTAAGHFVDLRYRVLDPAGANEALGPGVKPFLIDDASGQVMAVPMTAKLGSLRQTQADQRPNRTYFVLFANTAGVRAGSRVTADLGGMRFTDLIVE